MFIQLLLSLAIKSRLGINELQHLFMKREICFGHVTHNCINNLDTPITWHYMIIYFMVTLERTLDTIVAQHIPLLAFPCHILKMPCVFESVLLRKAIG